MKTIGDFIGPDAVAAITQERPEQATGLPNACYTEPNFLALENELLFARTRMSPPWSPTRYPTRAMRCR